MVLKNIHGRAALMVTLPSLIAVDFKRLVIISANGTLCDILKLNRHLINRKMQ